MKKSSKYLLMADVHLSNKLPYAVPMEGGKTDRFVGQLQMLADIAGIGDANAVDGYIICGDLFDKSVVDPVTFFESAKALQQLREHAPVYILSGNHDSVTISGGPYITDIFELLGLEVINHTNYLEDEFVRFCPLEYLSIDDSVCPLEHLNNLGHQAHETGQYSVLLFHNSVVGAKNGGYVSEKGFAPRAFLGDFDLALGGHFHEPQEIIPGLEYIGAPMQHHFGDCGKKNCVMIAEFSKNGLDIERIEMHGPKFFQYDNADNINWKERSGDYVRLTIESTVPELHEMASMIKGLKAKAEEHGVHFFFQHNPVYQHAMRMDTNRDELSYVALIDDYVKSDEVNTGKLNLDKLTEYGQRMLKKALETK